MNIEKEIEDIRHQLSVIAASMAFRDDLSNDLFCRAEGLQKTCRAKFEKDKIKYEAFKKYLEMKEEIRALEEDYPEFKVNSLYRSTSL